MKVIEIALRIICFCIQIFMWIPIMFQCFLLWDLHPFDKWIDTMEQSILKIEPKN